jgi:hypothetical protein
MFALLSANLLPLTVSERVAHARLATLRRADRGNDCRLYWSDRRRRDGTDGGWTDRGHVNRTLAKRLHLSIDTLADTFGICSSDADGEKEKSTQPRANTTANTTAHWQSPTIGWPDKVRSGSDPVQQKRAQCQRSIWAGTSFSRGDACSVIDVPCVKSTAASVACLLRG